MILLLYDKYDTSFVKSFDVLNGSSEIMANYIHMSHHAHNQAQYQISNVMYVCIQLHLTLSIKPSVKSLNLLVHVTLVFSFSNYITQALIFVSQNKRVKPQNSQQLYESKNVNECFNIILLFYY